MILITGASGNVGSEVLKQAMAAKLKLTAAYQSAEKAQTAPGNVHTVVLDYGNLRQSARPWKELTLCFSWDHLQRTSSRWRPTSLMRPRKRVLRTS
jgi:putative NADH-flavin reductase